ncbi:aldehyde dehydrogenase [Pseudonocardia kujensis]|nr:aldehyde dehydrogenase [Pseudonocardia kujensis]
MTDRDPRTTIVLEHAREFYVDGKWTTPADPGRTIEVLDSTTEEPFLRVAEATEEDISAAVAAARRAFDDGPWPRMAPSERAGYIRAFAQGIRDRAELFSEIWTRESGVLHSTSEAGFEFVPAIYDRYADLAESFTFDEPAEITQGKGRFALLRREPVGVVGAVAPWNAPVLLAAIKLGPAFAAGCTVVVKGSPEAPGNVNLMAEVADSIGLPPGVLNVVTADREASEALVRDPRVDKIAFTGSTATGRRIAALCGERIARYTLELGGKSAALVLDDFDIDEAARILSREECFLSGQVCSSLTRIIVSRDRHDDLVDALTSTFSQVKVGDPFDADTEMGPLISDRQRTRALGLIERGRAEGAILTTGGGTPEHLDRGWFMEPTVFARVDNDSVLAREEIFGPVLSVLPADGEEDAIRIANDSIYGLNASVFTEDLDKAHDVLRRMRAGTAGHNDHHTDLGIAFGGYKQSGLGREGGREGLLPYLETKTLILQGRPTAFDTEA